MDQDLLILCLKLIIHPCQIKIFFFQKLVRHFLFPTPKDTTCRTHLSTLINVLLAEVAGFITANKLNLCQSFYTTRRQFINLPHFPFTHVL